MCDSRVEEDVVHFLVGYGGFESSGWMNFGSGRGRNGGIAIGKRGGGHM